MHILNAPTKMMKQLGYGSGYQYDHDADGQFSGQDHWMVAETDAPPERLYRPDVSLLEWRNLFTELGRKLKSGGAPAPTAPTAAAKE